MATHLISGDEDHMNTHVPNIAGAMSSLRSADIEVQITLKKEM